MLLLFTLEKMLQINPELSPLTLSPSHTSALDTVSSEGNPLEGDWGPQFHRITPPTVDELWSIVVNENEILKG